MTYLSMYRGDDRILTITADEDLTGSDIRFTARARKRDAEPVIEKSLGEGITLGDPGTTAVVVLDAADTADLEPGALFWDIEVTDAVDKVHTVATGRLAVIADITLPAE